MTTPPEAQKPTDDEALRELVETAARAYFSTCRKLARAINRLKAKG